MIVVGGKWLSIETVFSMDLMTGSIELPIKRPIPKKRIDDKQEK
jgi:hypothetical protein